MIPVVEAAFDLTAEREPWLWGIADRARAMLDDGLGVAGVMYEFDADARLSVPCAVHAGCDPQQASALAAAAQRGLSLLASESHPTVVEWLREGREPLTRLAAAAEDTAVASLLGAVPELTDGAVLLGRANENTGVALLVPMRSPFVPTMRRRVALSRLARQLGQALSLRLSLDSARLAGESLADAFRRLTADPAHASSLDAEEDWARWIDGSLSLVDSFERDGRRFIVALRAAPESGDPRVLTPMERTVAGYAAHGFSNQLIAQTLGLGPSTIAGLLQRVVQKLGLSHRSQLALLASDARRIAADRDP